jgi:DNA replication protein DnaC
MSTTTKHYVYAAGKRTWCGLEARPLLQEKQAAEGLTAWSELQLPACPACDAFAEDLRPAYAEGKFKARQQSIAAVERKHLEAFEAEARALVLCPPDCEQRHPRFPEMHCHTFLDMWRAFEALDYGWHCRRAQEQQQDAEAMDVRPYLARAGVRDVHRSGLAQLDGQRTAVRAMRTWLAQPRNSGTGAMTHPWLVLTGGSDTGKTQAAAAVLEHFIRRFPWNERPGGGGDGVALRPFVLIHSADFVQLARQAKAYSLMGNSNMLVEEACRARVLVLDDVGTERMGAEEVELFQRIANERHASRRVTVWTSNVAPTELKSRLDFAGQEPSQLGRLWRRVADMAAVVELVRTGSRMTMGGRVTEFPTLKQDKWQKR